MARRSLLEKEVVAVGTEGAHKGGSIVHGLGLMWYKSPYRSWGLWAERLEAAFYTAGWCLQRLWGDLTETSGRAAGGDVLEKAIGAAGSPCRNREVSAGVGGSSYRKEGLLVQGLGSASSEGRPCL